MFDERRELREEGIFGAYMYMSGVRQLLEQHGSARCTNAHQHWQGTTEPSNIKNHHKVMQVTAEVFLCRHLTTWILIASNGIISDIHPWQSHKSYFSHPNVYLLSFPVLAVLLLMAMSVVLVAEFAAIMRELLLVALKWDSSALADSELPLICAHWRKRIHELPAGLCLLLCI